MPKRIQYSNQKFKILQANLSSIRNIANWTAKELGAKIGVTKQTISNLENSNGQTNNLNSTQYLAIRSVIDHEITITDNPVLKKTMDYLKLKSAKDIKIAQLGAASKAAYTSQIKNSEQTNLERKTMAVFALLPLTTSILGSTTSTYKPFSFFDDVIPPC
ncbi:helix-turn-helix transcriptional regulator [Streptococcus mutans OMZ175]|uniref:helix-turn-helix transcriptional regulator n=1 Tax=Streptococcus mutans TaxID=1309 RepID=UPI0002B55E95|nr:helix-turn-helix transcriptional regulator [Streptococcus mutans]EMC58600.1 hypothetical protein SMU109_04599 [Streptococcus mutans OMZ175]QZS44920.1 helix-turn-helix transcriptional regulator [Streptococcus mutans OMZ175]